MVRTQIQLTEKQAKDLKRIAASRHRSVAELIRGAVDNMIKSTALVDIEERRNRALKAIGKFRSGKTDISVRHDDYLAEAFEK
jgi:hypothetical protein